jgi:hypothetical protein
MKEISFAMQDRLLAPINPEDIESSKRQRYLLHVPLKHRVSNPVGHMSVAGGWPKAIKKERRAYLSELWRKQ